MRLNNITAVYISLSYQQFQRSNPKHNNHPLLTIRLEAETLRVGEMPYRTTKQTCKHLILKKNKKTKTTP